MYKLDRRVLLATIIWVIAILIGSCEGRVSSEGVYYIVEYPFRPYNEPSIIVESDYIPERLDYELVTLIVTAYAPFDNQSGMCNDGDPTRTSTGTYPSRGTIAVNPRRFPYGTKFYIEGYGEGVALDTGGAMRQNSNKIDVFVDTYKEAINWGMREIEVKVYKEEYYGN